MIVIPAIDLKAGKVVRLAQGQFDQVTEYSDDPIATAQMWVEKGAQRIHLVDLDGALNGVLKSFPLIAQLTRSMTIPIEMGGGIRTKEDIHRLFDCGVAKVILGTKAIEDRQFLKDVIQQWPEDIIVSLDCRGEYVAQRGWMTISDRKATQLAQELKQMGVSCLIYTDITRDGMLTGPNIPAIKELLETVPIPMIASGGISTLGDIRNLCPLASQGLFGVITGRALYEGKLDLAEAIKLCSQNV